MMTKPGSFFPFSLLLGILSLHPCASQGHERDKFGNELFDPDAPNTTKRCWIPAYQDREDFLKPREGLCKSSSMQLKDLSEENLRALAVEYAPILFFHPLEKYTLSNVDYTFSKTGRIWNTNGERYIVDNSLNMTVLLQTTRDPVWALSSNKFYFETDIAFEMYDSPVDVQYGDGYDSQGRSKATIYYNIYEAGNNTWAINYFFYYPYNGEGNMGLLATHEGVNSFTRFTLKPYGTHEGDWENMGVLICPPLERPAATGHQDRYIDWGIKDQHNSRKIGNLTLRTPLGVVYRQHSWSELKDCTKGECKFYKDSLHPVGFVALNSHATYPESVEDIVYQEIDLAVFYNMQSFVVVDRTVYKKEDGSYNYFFPTLNNTERLLKPSALQNYPMGLSDLFKPYYWQAFGGLWGNSEGIKVDPEPPLCLNEDQTGYEDCPSSEDNPVFDLVMQAMSVYPASGTILSLVQSVTSQVVELFSETGKGPDGPVAKGYFQRWISPKRAPLWNKISNYSLTAEAYCDMRMDISFEYSVPFQRAQYDIFKDFLAAIVVSVVLTITNITLMLLSFYRYGSKPYQPIYFDKSGVPHEPNKVWYGHFHYSLGAIIYTFFFLCMVAAGLLFLNGTKSLFQALTKYVPILDWTAAEVSLSYLCVAVILLNTLLLVILWLQVFEMRNMIQGAYYKVMGDSSRGFKYRGDANYVPWSPNVVEVVLRACYGLLFLSFLLTLLSVVIGMATIGFTYSTTRACNTASALLDSYCMDLSFLGVEKLICGDTLQGFCSDWNQIGSRKIFWSPFMAFICHFYLVGSVAYAMQQRRAIPAILAQYRKWAAGDVVKGALKSISPPKPKKEDSSSNVRFILPGKDRPESPIFFDIPLREKDGQDSALGCEDQEHVATRSLVSGMSIDGGRPSLFSVLWGDEEEAEEEDEDDLEEQD